MNAARCVIVVWSEASVEMTGDFVHDEAGRAKARGILLPLRIDDVQEPLGFGEVQSLDLIGWSGNADDPRFHDVVAAATALVAGTQAPTRATIHETRRQNWIEQAVGFIPAYVSDLLHLLSGPKQFIGERLVADERPLERAFVFAFVSWLLANISTMPIQSSVPWVTDLAFAFGTILALGGAVLVAWRLVGARAPIQSFFIVHLYVASIFRFGLALFFLSFVGTLSVWDRAAFEDVTALAKGGDILGELLRRTTHVTENRGWLAALGVAYVVLAGMLIWGVFAWGAYRRLNALSKTRSALAFLLFCILSLPVFFLTAIVANALMGARAVN